LGGPDSGEPRIVRLKSGSQPSTKSSERARRMSGGHVTKRQIEKRMGKGPKSIASKGGGGAHNWGDAVADQMVGADPNAGLPGKPDPVPAKGKKTEEKNKEEPKTQTYDEYKAQLAKEIAADNAKASK